MMDEHKISEKEWALLDGLWAVERTTARGLTDHLAAEHGWAYSTVKTMLDRMVDKGLVDARQVGNVWEYEPALEASEARRSAWKRFVGAAFGGAMTPALEFIATDAKLTTRQREALRKMLDGGGS